MPRSFRTPLSTRSHRPLPGPFGLHCGTADGQPKVDITCQSTGTVVISNRHWKIDSDAIACANLLVDALNHYRVQPTPSSTPTTTTHFVYEASDIGVWGVDLFYKTPRTNIYIATVDQFDTACGSILVAQWLVNALNTLGREPCFSREYDGVSRMIFPSLGRDFL